MKNVTDPADDLRREKLRIAVTRQISRWGWRLVMEALEAAAKQAAEHQKTNRPAAELWQWRAQLFRELWRRQNAPESADRTQNASGKP